ncbi:MAG: hypothetical protein ABSD81_02815 [Methanomicrobiales archaeon]|jgi:hypothetical protein
MPPIDRLRIKLLNLILNYIGSHHWTNYDSFTEDFVERIIASFQVGDFDLLKIISKAPSTFFRFNSITKESFLTDGLAKKIKEIWEREIPTIVDFVSIFPEIKRISDEEANTLIAKIGIPEEDIQNALRAALRSKGASPIPRRGKDSPLEIADIEHLRLTIASKILTFVVIVKGYGSIRSARLSWEDIAHQVTRAYSETHPDYLLILTAKEPKDGVITHLTKFAQDVGNPNLVILVTPLDLAKFLRAFGTI